MFGSFNFDMLASQWSKFTKLWSLHIKILVLLCDYACDYAGNMCLMNFNANHSASEFGNNSFIAWILISFWRDNSIYSLSVHLSLLAFILSMFLTQFPFSESILHEKMFILLVYTMLIAHGSLRLTNNIQNEKQTIELWVFQSENCLTWFSIHNTHSFILSIVEAQILQIYIRCS